MKSHFVLFLLIIGILFILFFVVYDRANAMKQHYLDMCSELKNKISEYDSKIEKENKLLKKVFSTNVKGKPVYSIPVTATGYSAREEECGGTPEYTASMTPSRVGVIAISNDLEKEIGLKMGQMVLIENMGLFRIEDRMNKRWKKRIDILHGNQKAAMLFGKQEVKITWIGRG